MMNVYLDGSEFALKRFEVSSSKVSVFIASVQSVRSLATLLALVVGVILILIGDNFLSGDSKKWFHKAGAILSAFLLTLFAFLQLIFFCSSHGHQYVITGAFTSILHYILKRVLNSLQLDINFWLIAIHLFVVFLVAYLGFVVFSAAVLLKDQKNGSGSSGSSSGSSSQGFAVFVFLSFLVVLLILTILLFQAGHGTAAFFLFCVGFVSVVVVTYVVLLQSEEASSAAVSAAVIIPTILAILSGLLILYGFMFWGVIMFCVGFVSVVVVTYVVLLQSEEASSAQSAAVFAAVIIPTFLAILSGLLILYGFMFWGVIMFIAALLTFIVLTAAVVGFPSDPSKALGASVLLLILVVLMFLTILLFQADHGTVAVLLLLVGLGTFIFVSFALKGQASGSSGGSSSSDGSTQTDPRTLLDLFKLGAQAAWAPITMAVVAMAFEFVIYPVICPILTVESSKHHTILLWSLIVETFSGTMVFILCDKSDIKKPWVQGDANGVGSGSGTQYPRQYYHLLWFLFIPYFGLGIMFLWALHHPNSGFSNALKFGVWGGILTCVYYFFVENLVNIGFGCVYDHAEKGAQGSASKVEDNHSKAAGYVMNFTNFLTNSFSVIFGFLMKAHLANYLNCSRKLAEGHVFPTASMNGFRSCWFWFSCASSGAWKNFISLFSLDIKEMLLS
ncbi:uncharacterized protein BdWA1_003515 [Babesia duncani]|uniref:Uncharacterized protein n=1 Tax=Babesia duncani TaxID=323732 RepID=A0AAD9PH35_9APIC|nr:hypothetical protein BdWA1_004112 [Babesia duncani]KAK2194436.1 hypothetical protein BdWA1_004096 [Babesia duncani]KAK2194884.1 hypothetical protein BdWA1_003644 [Babesia duncani]KAK2195011.1 hypothetical protein BdWA1_003515 [Babesia duncani]